VLVSDFLATNGSWVAALIVGTLSALAGMVSVRAKAQSDKDAARAPEWVGLTSQQTAMLEFMRSQLADQEERIRALEAEASEMKSKYWRLVAWARRVIVDDPQLLTRHPLHETIKHDL
jgi:hypothetical protein